jgi:hypothetical protein
MENERREKTGWQINIESQITAIESEVKENTAVTVQTKERVDEVHEILITIKGALKALGWLAKIAKYVSYVLGLISAVWVLYYQATHHGDTPKIDLPK